MKSDDGTRPQSRGGKGRIDIKTTGRNGPVVAVRRVTDGDGLMLMTSSGMLVRINASTISKLGRNTQGVRVVKLREDDQLIDCATTPGEAGDEAEATPSSPAESEA